MSWSLIIFSLFIVLMLFVDLGLFQKKAHAITQKEALIMFGVWTAMALVFNLGIVLFHDRGTQAGIEFFTGYLVEKSLSIDNIFLFILIFGYFRVPPAYQHKVLFWGIISAIIMRMGFIVGGMALMKQFHWMIYLFGSFLLGTGIAMVIKKDSHYDPSGSRLVRLCRKVFRIGDRYDNDRFFSRVNGRLVSTPLLLVLLLVESSDILFALDSIPAIFAITPDPFIVYTSNVFAMLGLRSLYFAVSGFMQTFYFLHYGFASIILILGMKMLLSDVWKIPVSFSLGLVVVILMLCIIVSLLRPRRADLKPTFERTERLGLIPFNRLLLIENVIDFGELSARHAMRPSSGVRVIRTDLPWTENLQMMRAAKHSRYPLTDGQQKPFSLLHVKSLLSIEPDQPVTPDLLRQLAKPCREVNEKMCLEDVLLYFQGHGEHLAIVVDDSGRWTGIITIEDVLEELVGKIDDEFDLERTGPIVVLADALAPQRVLFGLDAQSMDQAIARLVKAISSVELPLPHAQIIDLVLARERSMSTYLGKGLAIPHARIPGLARPLLAFARSDAGIPLPTTNERAELLFLLLTPVEMARLQPRLLGDIVRLFQSEYVSERLRDAEHPEAVIEAIRAGQLASD